MHEPFEPRCSFCVRFVRCFPDSSLLAEWGYCLERVADGPPGREALKALERIAKAGAFQRLLAQASALGLYEETDDGCERFEAGTPQRPGRADAAPRAAEGDSDSVGRNRS